MVDFVNPATKSEPYWRLMAPTGQLAECYLDALDGTWMLLVWRGDELVLTETCPTQAAGEERCTGIRSGMVADGWSEPTAEEPSLVHGPRTAWLFTRGRDSVRLEVQNAERGVQLIVRGPGVKRATYDFPDTLALLVHQAEMERQLVGLGFFLEKFITDRRRYPR
jgi:hypothetical protein